VVRAGIQRPDMVAALGIRLQPYMTIIVMLGVGMAAMGGAFFAPITIVHPAMGAEIITVTFVVVVIGGLGTSGAWCLRRCWWAWCDASHSFSSRPPVKRRFMS